MLSSRGEVTPGRCLKLPSGDDIWVHFTNQVNELIDQVQLSHCDL
jgi:hypothetical protein